MAFLRTYWYEIGAVTCTHVRTARCRVFFFDECDYQYMYGMNDITAKDPFTMSMIMA
jgi:hypothetical protein